MRIPKRHLTNTILNILQGFCVVVAYDREQKPFLYTLDSDKFKFKSAYDIAVENGYKLAVDSDSSVYLIKRKKELIYQPLESLKRERFKQLYDGLKNNKVVVTNG